MSEDTRPRCAECGEPRRLRHGVCEWRFGCEHRQLQASVRNERILAALANQTEAALQQAAHNIWRSP